MGELFDTSEEEERLARIRAKYGSKKSNQQQNLRRRVSREEDPVPRAFELGEFIGSIWPGIAIAAVLALGGMYSSNPESINSSLASIRDLFMGFIPQDTLPALIDSTAITDPNAVPTAEIIEKMTSATPSSGAENIIIETPRPEVAPSYRTPIPLGPLTQP